MAYKTSDAALCPAEDNSISSQNVVSYSILFYCSRLSGFIDKLQCNMPTTDTRGEQLVADLQPVPQPRGAHAGPPHRAQ
ncbi:jg21978 [Pararge aegeria aegeria]|uniref:Jg21978 protein n=1 Tax=Pararge aegeria aegeria TaxID=348720 RepID=A0A8S4QVZ1_9NEOP|nr:jg21978 [Pararge aegeria aegeria]